MSGHIEVDQLSSFIDVMIWIKQQNKRLRTMIFDFLDSFLFCVLQFLYIHG